MSDTFESHWDDCIDALLRPAFDELVAHNASYQRRALPAIRAAMLRQLAAFEALAGQADAECYGELLSKFDERRTLLAALARPAPPADPPDPPDPPDPLVEYESQPSGGPPPLGDDDIPF